MFKILVVDDEQNIRNLLKLRLSAEGYEIITASNGQSALDAFYKDVFDLLIVDVMMPKMDGYEFVYRVREINQNIPVIMVTAKSHINDKKAGFNVGIDDYMTKPIEFDELLLRIKALLRRAKINTDKRIAVGDTVLDFDTLTVKNDKLNLSVTLQKKEFLILYKLLSYPEKTFSKSSLFDEFWGLDNFGDTDAVKVYISKIRSVIQPFSDIDIMTVRGIGYRGIKREKK